MAAAACGPPTASGARRPRRYYRVRPAIRTAAWALAASLSVVVLPLLALLVGLLVYPLGFRRISGHDVGRRALGGLHSLVQIAFDPGFLPSVLPRALMISLALFVGTLGLGLVRAGRGAGRVATSAPIWWRVIGAPLSAEGVEQAISGGLWQLVGGAAGAKRPGRSS